MKRGTQIYEWHDGISGKRARTLRRVLYFVNKDGTLSKHKPIFTSAKLILYPDGSYRYYNRNGVLARERITPERHNAEMAVEVDFEDDYGE